MPENCIFVKKKKPIAMLSILIPTHNYICTNLVKGLLEQAQACFNGKENFEIIVADDASSDASTLMANKEIGLWEHCFFHKETTNVGRASIRNKLADMAHCKYLLFIDCDAGISRSDFIKKYITTAIRTNTVVCGSLQNVPSMPSPRHSLRYLYEERADRTLRTMNYRSAHPYGQFSSFNFLIPKDLFQRIRFNEQCTQYGYEDAIFGKNLQQQDISIVHIDNPLIHLGIETNDEFLKKTEISLQTLHSFGHEAATYAQIARISKTIHSLGLSPLLCLWHRIFASCEQKNLLGEKPSLLIFQLYKLGYFNALNS